VYILVQFFIENPVLDNITLIGIEGTKYKDFLIYFSVPENFLTKNKIDILKIINYYDEKIQCINKVNHIKYKKLNLIIYTFKINELTKNSRASIFSMVFIPSDLVNFEDFFKLIKFFIDWMDNNYLLRKSILENHALSIFSALNKLEPINISSRIFETPKIIEKEKLKIPHINRKLLDFF